jgi:hypothetical protein
MFIMTTRTLPSAIIVSRAHEALVAWVSNLRAAWSRARRRQHEWEELQSLAELDHRTLMDIGWPDDMRRRCGPVDRRSAQW